MAKFNYSDFVKESSSMSTGTFTRSKVGYFNSLKDDGDVAIVRFAYKSTNEFDIVSVHKVQIDGKYRNVSCLRHSLYEEAHTCPLCVEYDDRKTRFFIKLIEYTRDETGNIVATPKIWERPAGGKNGYDKKIAAYLSEYGDLTKYVFKVIRHGAKGSLYTDYDIIPVNQEAYPANVYVADFSDFATLDLAHHSYLEKTYEEMNAYCETGKFPATSSKKTEGTASAIKEKTTDYNESNTQYNSAPQSARIDTSDSVRVSVTPTVSTSSTPSADAPRPRRTTYTF